MAVYVIGEKMAVYVIGEKMASQSNALLQSPASDSFHWCGTHVYI